MKFVQLNNIAKVPEVNAFDPQHIIQMFIHYSQIGPPGVAPFTPFSFSIAHALADRVKGSKLLLKSMHVGTKIKIAVLDGAGLAAGVRLIDEFQHQITSVVLPLDPDLTDVAEYMNCLFSLVMSAMQVISTPIGYIILRKSVPFFLALAAKFPELWTDGLSLPVQYALSHSRFEIPHFVFFDTVTALVLGTVPLVHYDISLHPMVQPPEHYHIDWAHGCSHIVITLLAVTNSWRAARLLSPTHPIPTLDQQQEFLACLQQWNPSITCHDGDQAASVMGRLAVQEIWRHSVIVYMYMGMCGADSADPQVEASVRQIAQLSATIEDGHPLEAHMTIPCIVGAAAARKEKHRAVLRKKIVASRDQKVCLIRGADFALVLDHLWHGVGAGGQPTTWEDYVNSRFIVLPVDV
ncbi:Fungal specific transcription factor domain [Rhizoctonia solani]|uniref:Fungal specific transcription factor domain n=1 Tax=Rhizoctonia solani TaxID=456999 RepID=A0A8H8NYF9_9AGAM|nr:Fungal specific transcription factor domain [Rhizoctonia solani]QRW20970.1 Fungal specific transcription factor domain [Rhizoctonia solani]